MNDAGAGSDRAGRQTGRASAALTEASFRLLIEINADGILVTDRAGTVLYANPAAAAIFGVPAEELLSVPLGLPLVSGDTAEVSAHRPDGTVAQLEMRAVAIAWRELPAMLVSLRDISDRRAREEARLQAQKMEALGQLTAGIVHDFNNILTVTNGGLDLLEKQLAADPASPRVKRTIKTVRDGTERATVLVRQLLAFARGQPLAPERVDVNRLIAEFLPLVKRAAGDGVVLEIRLDPARPEAFVDAHQLQTAVLNLVVNARDAMDGNGTIIIETGSQPAEAPGQLRDVADFVRLSVRDTGTGMSQPVLARAFEPFFTTKDKGKGTGLGLSQVYGFAKQSGGNVAIDTSPGRGTSVHLFLPPAPEEDATGLPSL